jgi:hypothetical protein
LAQVATHDNIHTKIIKKVSGLGTHVLKGEGDTFFKERGAQEHLLVEAPQVI